MSLIKIVDELVAMRLSEGARRRNLGQKITLHIDPFRAVLLDECTARDGAHDFGVKAQPASRGALDEAHTLQRRPKPVDERP